MTAETMLEAYPLAGNENGIYTKEEVLIFVKAMVDMAFDAGDYYRDSEPSVNAPNKTTLLNTLFPS